MPKRTASYNAWQMEKLANPVAAAAFLNAAFADSQEMFLVALRKVAQSKEMASVAKEAGVTREALYHALSEEGNPTLTTLEAVLGAVGMEISIVPKGATTTLGNSIFQGSFSAMQRAGDARLATEVTGAYTSGLNGTYICVYSPSSLWGSPDRALPKGSPYEIGFIPPAIRQEKDRSESAYAR